MSLDLNNLPVRLKARKDQPKGFHRERRGRYFLKSAEFKKIYNRVINPHVKELGFKVSGFNAVKQDEQFTYLINWSSSKWGGEGCMDVYIHPNGFPTKQEYIWTLEKAKNPGHSIFTKAIGREQINDWVDMGINEEEAIETCEYLLHHLKETYHPFVEHLSNFPENILEISTDNFHERYTEIYEDFGLAIHGGSKYYAAIWLAKFHSFYRSEVYKEIVEIAREEILAICKEKELNPASYDEELNNLKYGILYRFS